MAAALPGGSWLAARDAIKRENDYRDKGEEAEGVQ